MVKEHMSELHSILDQMAAESDEGLTVRELEIGLVELLDARRIMRARLFELARILANRIREEKPGLNALPGTDGG